LLRKRLEILRNRAVVHTLFASGMRAEEVCSLKRSSCEDGRASRLRVTGKGEKERLVLLNEEAHYCPCGARHTAPWQVLAWHAPFGQQRPPGTPQASQVGAPQVVQGAVHP
jgi:integrase